MAGAASFYNDNGWQLPAASYDAPGSSHVRDEREGESSSPEGSLGGRDDQSRDDVSARSQSETMGHSWGHGNSWSEWGNSRSSGGTMKVGATTMLTGTRGGGKVTTGKKDMPPRDLDYDH